MRNEFIIRCFAFDCRLWYFGESEQNNSFKTLVETHVSLPFHLEKLRSVDLLPKCRSDL